MTTVCRSLLILCLVLNVQSFHFNSQSFQLPPPTVSHFTVRQRDVSGSVVAFHQRTNTISSAIYLVMNNKKKLYSFKEARRIARGHGFSSQEEFLDYDCPGAYQLPKNPESVWQDEWKGWDDWLGVPLEFEEGREIARKLSVKSKEEYLKIFEEKKITDEDDPASRLPYRPDLHFKNQWQGWEDWLGIEQKNPHIYFILSTSGYNVISSTCHCHKRNVGKSKHRSQLGNWSFRHHQRQLDRKCHCQCWKSRCSAAPLTA